MCVEYCPTAHETHEPEKVQLRKHNLTLFVLGVVGTCT